jgi:hypothetical protein
MKHQPWLRTARFDLAFICAPAFLVSLIALVSHGSISPSSAFSWLFLVVFVDVAHVYSTLFKTYFDREELSRRPVLYIAVPLAAWAAGVFLYTFGALTFWRVLAYLAVFHFVRQQYGFMRLYAHADESTATRRRVEAASVYLAALVPILHWHATLPKAFHWFVEGDFMDLSMIEPFLVVGWLTLAACLISFFYFETSSWRRTGFWNVPKTLIIVGTALSWSIGIVLFDDDWTFTLTNVVAHGIPYFALIWLTGAKKPASGRFSFFVPRYAWAFLAIPIAIAYFEEGLWDAWVWGEHATLYPWTNPFAGIVRDRSIMNVLVPLLALPQATHYLLDGFIWKRDR